MLKGEEVAIYEWQTASPFLFSALCPSSSRLKASASDWAEDVLQSLSANVRLFAFHLNLTQTAFLPHNRSTLCRALLDKGVSVVNADVTNISKAFIQESCRRLGFPTTEATPDGEPDEMLIVKTNLNYGGLGEKGFDARDLRILGFSPAACPIDAKSYKILKRRDVSPTDWKDPSLFIERFVENAKNRFFRAYWLSEYLVISEVVDPLLIKKMPEGIQRINWFFRTHQDQIESIGSASPRAIKLAFQISVFVRFLKIDFGALDAVVDDDERYHIIDVNTTPSWRDTVAPGIVTFLRAGLDVLVDHQREV